jgi:hypothetical protein
MLRTSPALPGVTRRWTTVPTRCRARIHGEIYYRFSTIAAQEMGRKIAELATTTMLLPARAPVAGR